MPNPFTPPPEGAPETVKGAYALLAQKFEREQEARVRRDVAEQSNAPASEYLHAEKDLAFAEQETNNAASLFFDELRFAADENRKTA